MKFIDNTLPQFWFISAFTLILLISGQSTYQGSEQTSSDLELNSIQEENPYYNRFNPELYKTASSIEIDLNNDNCQVTIDNNTSQPLIVEVEQLSAIKNFTNLKSLRIMYNYDDLDITTDNLGAVELKPITITPNLTTLQNLSISRKLRIGTCSYACVSNQWQSPTLSIENIDSLTNLSTLSITGFALDSYEPLTNLANLTSLRLESANLTSDCLSYIAYLPNLTQLDLTHNNLTYLDSLSYLTNLEYLNLAFNQIENVYPLSSLVNLQTLILLDNNIYDVSLLNNLPVLSYLNVGINNISNINSLNRLSTHAEIVFGDNSSNNLFGLNSEKMIGSGTAGTTPGGAPFQDQTLAFSLQTGIETCIYYPINFDGSYLTDYKLSDNFEDYLTITHITHDRICLTPHANTRTIEEYLYPTISFEVSTLDEPTFSGEPISIIYKTQIT